MPFDVRGSSRSASQGTVGNGNGREARLVRLGMDHQSTGERESNSSSQYKRTSTAQSSILSRSMGFEIHRRRRLSWLTRHLPRMPVFDPQKTVWLDRWDFLILVTLLEVTFAVPYELAFMEATFEYPFYMNRLTDLIFTVDMVLRFFIAVPDPQKRGCWIKDHQKIAYTYLTTWFVPDCVAIIPADLIILLSGSHSSTLSALRLTRTLRLAKVSQGLRLVHRWRTTLGLRNWLLSIVGLVYSLLVCCHWSACLWGWLPKQNRELNWLVGLRRSKGYAEDMYTRPVDIYFLALYWAVYTMAGIGYGDVTPQSPFEYKVNAACAAVMAASWAVVIAEVCAITSSFSVHEVHFKRTMDDLNWLLSEWKVDHQVRRRLRTYFMESRDIKRTLMQKGILEQMSPKLQGEVMNGLHRSWTGKIRFLRHLSEEALVSIVQRLGAMLYAPDELIPPSRTLYIVRRGVAVLLGKVMLTGTPWGEDLILHNHHLRKSEAARALCYLEVNSLNYRDLREVAEAFPDLQRDIREAARCIAVQRSVVLISKVVKQLRFHGMVPEELPSSLIYRLVEAGLTGELSADFIERPEQRAKVRQMLKEIADEEELSNIPSDGSGSIFDPALAVQRHVSTPTVARSAHLLGTLRLEAEDLMNLYNSRLEILLNNVGASHGKVLSGGTIRSNPRSPRARRHAGRLATAQLPRAVWEQTQSRLSATSTASPSSSPRGDVMGHRRAGGN